MQINLQRRFFLSFLACLLLLAPQVRAQDEGLPEPLRRKIETVIRDAMAKEKIPGVSISIVTERKVRWSDGFGTADLENSVPAMDKTVYRLASISKTIAAVAAMQLYERGKLDLDAPVQKYVPTFPEKQWSVTTRQLLGHLSGIRHYKGDEIDSTRYYPTLQSALKIFQDDPLLHEPETKYTYTTYGYTLIGCVVEGASGQKFTEYVKENIFRPAGMETARVDEAAAIISHRAAGYRKTQQGELQNSGLADTSYKIPGGGFCATAEDLARFAIALMEGKLLKSDTMRLMFTPLKTRDGKSTNYGLGWGISEENGTRVVSHSGGQQRVNTFLWIAPEAGRAVVVLANLEGAGSGTLARAMAKELRP